MYQLPYGDHMSSTTGEPPVFSPPGDGPPGVRTGPALPPEIVAELRACAAETLARHQPLPDGRCFYCSATWVHTNASYPCPPVRIAHEFLQLTDAC